MAAVVVGAVEGEVGRLLVGGERGCVVMGKRFTTGKGFMEASFSNPLPPIGTTKRSMETQFCRPQLVLPEPPFPPKVINAE